MPPLRLFNRSWHISSDDLALPALVGVAFHGTWTALIAAEVAIIGLPDDCAGRHLASSTVVWLLVSFALTTLLQCVVAFISMRGAMLEEHKRAAMPAALYCLLCAYCLEAAALVYSTAVNFGVLGSSITTCHTAEELARTAISELSLHRWFIGSTWAMLLVISGLLVLMYNLYPDRGLESWEKRVNCLSYMLCCRKAMANESDDEQASAPTVVRLARVFGDLFYPLNFSFTDTLAAITLVGITHRSSAHGHGSSSHNHALIAAAGAGVFGSAKHDAAEGATALLEAAVAAAKVRAAAGTATAAALEQQPDEQVQQQQQAATSHSCNGQTASAGGLGMEAAGDTCSSASAARETADMCEQQQDVDSAGRAALEVTAERAASVSCLDRPSPSPVLLKGMRHSSSTGNIPSAAGTGVGRAGSPLLPEAAVSQAGRSASSSAWEFAVRQGSTLAVAPGRGFLPSPIPAVGGGSPGFNSSSRASSPAQDSGVAMPARSYSTREGTAAAQSSASSAAADGPGGGVPTRFAQRALSWGGSAAGIAPSHNMPPHTQQAVQQGASSSEQASPQGLLGSQREAQAVAAATHHSTLHSLAEVNELSMTQQGMGLEQVQSLLSPLQSSDIAAVAGEGGIADHQHPAAAGDAVGAAAPAAMAAPAAVTSKGLYSSPATHHQQQQQALYPALPSPGAQAEAEAAAEAALEAEGAVMGSGGQPVPLELLEEALHWHTYANAVYGWPMFLWSHRYRVLRCCRLCCGGCCKGAPQSSGRSSGGGILAAHTPQQQLLHADGAGVKGKGVIISSSSADNSGGVNGVTGVANGLPVTTVVTMSSVDTDSVSPGSTAAGAAEGLAGANQHTRGQAQGPLGEGVERTAAAAGAQGGAQQQLAESAGAGSAWDLEQGGTAAGGGASGPAAAAASNTGGGGGGSGRRWITSRGNVWLLQGVADALGLSGRGVAAAGAAAVQPPCTSTTPAGSQANCTSCAVHEAAGGSGSGAATSAASCERVVGRGGSGGGGGSGSGGGSDSRKTSAGGLRSATGGLWADEGLCGSMCGGKWGSSHVPKMAPLTASQRLTNEAILQTANIPAADLLYVNYSNLIEGLLPYSVALDVARRCVVVAIRGSLSVEDCVTDILYDPAPLDEEWLLQPPSAVALAEAATTITTEETCRPAHPTSVTPQHGPHAPWLLQGSAAASGAGAAAAAASGLPPPYDIMDPSMLQLQLEHLQQQQQRAQEAQESGLLSADAGSFQLGSSTAGGGGGGFATSRSMPGASSGGGSFRSVKASPFAAAAAAAAAAARTSSTGISGDGGGSRPGQQQQPPPSAAAAAAPAQQQQPQPQPSGLARLPSVPAAQAAAAAAAAGRLPLPPAPSKGQGLRKQWSVSYAGLQHTAPPSQQPQQLGSRLSEQPSFLRRAASTFKQRQQSSRDDEHAPHQQQQLASRPSVLETALSVLRGPWRRATGSDTGEHRRHTPRTPDAAAAEEGRMLTSIPSSRGGGGRRADAQQEEPGSGFNSPRKLFKTLSLNLATALGGGGGGRGQGAGQQQQQPPSARRRLAATTSSRLLGAGRDSVLQSYASEMIPSSSAPNTRRSTADVWLQSQTRRTTAADRALGAARAGHRYAPMTSAATDKSAAAAAASQRSFMLQQHQQQHRQQQQLQQQLSSMASMRSTAPASTVAPAASAAAAAAGGVVSEPGAVFDNNTDISPTEAAAAAAAEQGHQAVADVLDADQQHSGGSSAVRSRRSTFTQLPRINSGAGAAGAAASGGGAGTAGVGEEASSIVWQQQQQHALSMMASVPVPAAYQSQQHQQGRPHARPASDDGSSMGGAAAAGGGSSSATASGRHSLRSTVSDVSKRALRFKLPLRLSPRQLHQQQQLLDGGPTDWSLLSGAARMVPSRTAAVPPLPPSAATAAGGGAAPPRLSTSFSARPAPGTAHASSAGGLSTNFSCRPSGATPYTPFSGAGLSTASSIGGAAASTAAAPTQGAVGAASTATDLDASPFMTHLMQQPTGLQDGGTPLSSVVEASAFSAAAAAQDSQLLQQQQQQPGAPWLAQPLLDMSAAEGPLEAAAVAAAAAAAAAQEEEAALDEEAEAAAAAEADAVAAAAQAAAAEETPDTGAAGAQWFAHEGILNCARAIRDDLDRLGLLDQLLLGLGASLNLNNTPPGGQDGGFGGKQQQQEKDADRASGGIGVDGAAAKAGGAAAAAAAEEGRFLNSELPDCRGWTLVLTGHSLGAGVAALLALHYRARYEAVRAWCFAPPGGLMSPAAAASLKDICYSLVSAKDMIPRMSLWTIERLRDEMMICALRCKMPKYKLLLGAVLGRKWSEDEVLRPLEELSGAEVAAFQAYRHAVVEERSLDPLRVRIAREFVPPGEVLWLERCKQRQPRLRVPHTLTCANPAASAAAAAAAAALSPDSPQPAAATAWSPAFTATATAWSPAATAAPATATATATAAGAPGGFQTQARSVSFATDASSGHHTQQATGTGSGRSIASGSMLRGGSAALEAAALAVAGHKVVSRLQPHITDGLGLIVGGMVVSRNMFADHIPDKQLWQLRRLVRNLKRRQALGEPLPPGVAPVVVAAPPMLQDMPKRQAV